MECVGWVERSDTHQSAFETVMGFAKCSTHPMHFDLFNQASSTGGEETISGTIALGLMIVEYPILVCRTLDRVAANDFM
jgi:hypothetical protein